jgi:hypothetical protein
MIQSIFSITHHFLDLAKFGHYTCPSNGEEKYFGESDT